MSRCGSRFLRAQSAGLLRSQSGSRSGRFDAVVQAPAHFSSQSSAKAGTKSHQRKAPAHVAETSLGSIALLESAQKLPCRTPKSVHFPKARLKIKRQSIKVQDDLVDIFEVISDQMKTCSLDNKNLVAKLSDLKKQSSNNLSLLAQMHAENMRDRRLLSFSQIVAKFVAIEFREPLQFPSDFFDKLRDGDDLVLLNQVQSIGVKTGVTVEHILEWEPFIRDIFAIANPDMTKFDFIAVVQEMIAERRLSESSCAVFEKIYDAAKPK